ncbi:MAG: methyltransferase domain-containing protein [Candidatus Peregrinibacteria bacterium]
MIEYQRIILADKLRNSVFEKALKSVIHKGKSTVSDIGSGTGYLSFLASKLGAKECILYEMSELLELSRTLAKTNGIRNCHFVCAHSSEISKPPKTDIVISETLGNIALEEGIIETMQDAKRFLKPGGTLIPSALSQFVAPLVTDHLFREVTSWDRISEEFTFTAAREISLNNVYVRSVSPSDLLDQKDAIQIWDTIDFSKAKNSPVRSEAIRWKMASDAQVYGFALWWDATLVPGVHLSTSPSAPESHWEQVYLPVRDPLKLRHGDQLELQLVVDSRREVRINVAWEVRQIRGKTEVAKQIFDMQRGMIG